MQKNKGYEKEEKASSSTARKPTAHAHHQSIHHGAKTWRTLEQAETRPISTHIKCCGTKYEDSHIT